MSAPTPAYPSLISYLAVNDGAKAIAFYQAAFGATEVYRLTDSASGRIGHAELEFGSVIIMVSEEYPEYAIVGPASIGGTSVTIHLHVDDCDALIAHAVNMGAKLLRPPSDQFYGERSGTVRDPFGHEWLIGHNIEEVTPEEMQRRYTQMMST